MFTALVLTVLVLTASGNKFGRRTRGLENFRLAKVFNAGVRVMESDKFSQELKATIYCTEVIINIFIVQTSRHLSLFSLQYVSDLMHVEETIIKKYEYLISEPNFVIAEAVVTEGYIRNSESIHTSFFEYLILNLMSYVALKCVLDMDKEYISVPLDRRRAAHFGDKRARQP